MRALLDHRRRGLWRRLARGSQRDDAYERGRFRAGRPISGFWLRPDLRNPDFWTLASGAPLSDDVD